MRIPYYRSTSGDGAGNFGGPFPGMVVVAATYFYFLLFAEFALLHLLEAKAGGGSPANLGFLAGGGVVGSLGAVLLYRGHALRRGIIGGFALCGAAAGFAALDLPLMPLPFVALFTGLGTGLLTVTLASGLHRVFAAHSLGLWTAAGTGLAYAACNVPRIFLAPPTLQAGFAAAACLLGVAAASFIGTDLPAGGAARVKIAGGAATFWWLVGAFVVLVAFDSAVFLLIQERSSLRAAAWGNDTHLWLNAAVHLLAALLAGWMLERGLLRGVLALAGADLLLASADLAGWLPTDGALHYLYPAGVSLYSTALVALPALARRWPAAPAGAWRAAWLYIFAGWIGSGIGVGVARQWVAIPWPLLAGAGLALFSLLALARTKRGAALGVLLVVLAGSSGEEARAADPIIEGRRVYIAEGCIHCHSQFVRPGTTDEMWWGPVRPLAETLAGAPPLPGNRRQGPDLQNVGNRRSADWNRLHLLEPRVLAPGSVMPSYRHLFAANDPRGPALLAYLASLGADTAEARAQFVAGWRPPDLRLVAERDRGAKLFQRLCASCHGTAGRGDGVLASQLLVPPANLAAGPLPRTSTDDPAERERRVARIIQFGVPGTAMAGHETLPGRELGSLTAFVIALRIGPASP